jgi:ribosomal protein S18 acetylase RimI-like enzyme
METIENKEQAPIIIAPAMGADAEGISEASYETWLATYPNEEAGISREDIEEQMKNRRSPEEIEKTRSKILENNPNARMWVARENEKVVGFASLKKEPEFNQLKSIYILPSHQGKGIGQKLWAEILNDVGDDHKKMVVHVATYNTQAIEFYKKLGFRETGKQFSDERFRMKSGAVIPETELVIEKNG